MSPSTRRLGPHSPVDDQLENRTRMLQPGELTSFVSVVLSLVERRWDNNRVIPGFALPPTARASVAGCRAKGPASASSSLKMRQTRRLPMLEGAPGVKKTGDPPKCLTSPGGWYPHTAQKMSR